MKRKIVVIFVLAMFSFMLFACGASKQHCDAYGEKKNSTDTTNVAG